MGEGAHRRHGTYAVAPAPVIDEEEHEQYDGSHEIPHLTGARRTYLSDDGQLSVRTAAITRLRALAGDHDVVTAPFRARVEDGYEVAGDVVVARRNGTWQIGTGALRCTCGTDPCPHTARAAHACRALLAARRVRAALTDLQAAGDATCRHAAEEHASSEQARRQARVRPDPSTRYTDQPEAFQAAYRAARQRRQRGEPAVPYMTEHATGGLGDPHQGGRQFGVELEFDFPRRMSEANRARARRAIAAELSQAGLTDGSGRQQGYHAGARNGWRRWSFERDSSVSGGEVVSPILDDSPRSWQQLQTVCDTIRRHGGVPSRRTGSHVHVSLHDYDHTPENYTNLVRLYRNYEDTLFRLAQNPGARDHRGRGYCSPSGVPTARFRTMADVRRAGNHGAAVNFDAVRGDDEGDHLEFRLFDGSLDPGTIQTQIKLSLGLADAAFRTDGVEPDTHERLGTHLADNPRRRRLTGNDWQQATRSFRQLVDRVFCRDHDKEQATALFACTRWQR